MIWEFNQLFLLPINLLYKLSPNMIDQKKIKSTLESALQLLNKEIETEITNESKSEYLQVINEIQKRLKEMEEN